MKVLYFLSFIIISLFIFNNAYSEGNDVLKVQIINDSSGFKIDWVGVGVVVTMGGLIYTIIRGTQTQKLTKLSQDLENKMSFAKMLDGFEKDLQVILTEERKLQESSSEEDCQRVVHDYLNVLDRIAYLRKLEKIDDTMIDYFNHFFSYGLRYMWWDNLMNQNQKAQIKWENQWWWDTQERIKNKIETAPYLDLGYALRFKLIRKYGVSFIESKLAEEN